MKLSYAGRARFVSAMVALLASWHVYGQGAADGRAKAVLPIVARAYTFLHENPEVGHEEVQASKYIRAELERLPGFRFEPVKSLPTAVIAVLDTGRPGPTRAFRAELDARKLDDGAVEPGSHAPRSRIDGFMHNCGHDVHAAMLLGAAAVASNIRSNLHGKIVFVFQPAEEVRGGADDIVADGVLKRLGVTSIFAQHVAPGVPVGDITVSPGTPLAGSWSYTLTISGTASHAAVPFEGTDTALVAAKLAQEIAAFPAHGVDIANEPIVIGVARLKAEGPSLDALPAAATIEGTIRAFSDIQKAPSGGRSIVEILKRRMTDLGTGYGVAVTLDVRPGAPPTKNDDALLSRAVGGLKVHWGDRLTTPLFRGMFAEDFAYYTSDIPALYFGLGITKDTHGSGNIHSPEFTTHPDALLYGTRLLADLIEITDR